MISAESQGLDKGLLGALMIALSAAAAMMAVPAAHDEPGALLPSTLIMTVGVLSPIVFSFQNDVRRLLRGENILLAALVYWILFEMLQGAFVVQTSRDAVVMEFFLIGLTATGFWIGATVGKPLRLRLLMDQAETPWSNKMIFWMMIIAFFLGIFDFYYRANFDLETMITGLMLPRFDAPWQREALGDWSAFSAHLQFFGYLVPALAMMCFLREGAMSPKTWVGLALSAVIVLFNAQGGGRRIVGTLILSALFCWLIQHRKLTWRRIAISMGAVAALLVVMQLMLLYRNVGFGDASSELPEYSYLHVDGNFIAIAQLLELVPDVYPHTDWQFLIYAIVRPIPRVFWPGKPVDGGFDLAEAVGVPSTSFAMTCAGEFYLSFGFIGAIIGGWVYGRLSTLANALLEVKTDIVNPVLPSLVLVWLFVGVRSILEIMLFGYVILAVVATGHLVQTLSGLRRQSATAAPN